MRVYLVQHAQAKAEALDPQRPLTEQGAQEARKLGRFLGPLDLTVEEVWHSGKTRAVQTGEIFAASLKGAPRLIRQEHLSPNDAVGPVIEKLQSAEGDLMLVGHQPFLGRLASELLTGSESPEVVAFQQGGLVCLVRAEDYRWSVSWMLVPEILGGSS